MPVPLLARSLFPVLPNKISPLVESVPAVWLTIPVPVAATATVGLEPMTMLLAPVEK